MKHKILNQPFLLSTALLLFLALNGVHAQQSINSSAGEASGSQGTSSYTIGQAIYHVQTGTNGSVSAGINQPIVIMAITSTEEAKAINLSVAAYPNPTTDHLTLSIQDFDFSDISYHLYDMQGRLLQMKNIYGNTTRIQMNNLLPATYIVRIIAKNKEVKIFKIIKN